MKGLLERLSGLPVAIKLLLGLVLIAVVAVAAMLLLGLGPLATIVLVVGLLAVGLLLVVFLVVLAALRRRKAAPFEAELSANTGAVPEGISEAAARARLDDLRRRFEEGVATFKQHGKDMYSLPWYAIVGEPGSGKTEVLRHSNIGFPPGLQDELQGSGGTINMDWWFTNQAVILDTAGRLMFEDAAASGNSEWGEFLKLLARHRPNCPINGLMLVIPADSLIKDSSDEIDDKARRIARQLDLIQRTLDVRFPVFILITKSDLINGFREFFDGLDDPQLQHQILGWSNPQDLDAPFDPAGVQEHLLNIEDRLLRRRFGLMVDPVAREGAQARRLDEVDAMFALPEAMVGVTPRLRRYLEHIFPAGEWAAKPLFLRGLYFVSSMRDGSALDAELAEAMGVPLEQLPEGRVWERDRSYFLKDLFLDKMFREKGLVTRASNTRELRRKRRMTLFGATGLAAAALIAISLFQASALRNSVAGPRAFWEAAVKVYGADPAGDSFPTVVGGAPDHSQGRQEAADGLVYYGDDPVDAANRLPGAGERLSIARAAETIAFEAVDREITVPAIFRPAVLIAGGSSDLLGGGRREAGRTAIERSVLAPIVRRASEALGAGVPQPAEREAAVQAWIALVEMLRAADDVDRPVPSVGPLLRWTLRPSATEAGDWAEYDSAATSVASLDRSVAALAQGDGGRTWLREALRAARPRLLPDLNLAAGHLQQAWLAEFEGTGDSTLAVARRIGGALEAFEDAETAVLDRYGPVGAPGADDDLVPWDDAMDTLTAAAETLRETLPRLGNRSFAEFAGDAASRGLEGSIADVEAMLAVLPAGSGALLGGAGAGESDEDAAAAEDAGASAAGAEVPTDAAAAASRSDDAAALQVLRNRLESARTAIEARAETNEAEVAQFVELGPLLDGAGGRRAFELRFEMYRSADALRAAFEPLERFADLPGRLAALRTLVDERKQANLRIGQGLDTDRLVRAAAASNHVLERGLVLRQDQLVRLAIEQRDAPETADDVAGLVEELAAERGEIDALIDVPLAELPGRRGGFLPEFDRRSGPAVASALLEVERVLEGMPGPDAADAAETIRRALEDWVLDYAVYWGDMLTKREHLKSFSSWPAFIDELQRLRVNDVNDALADLMVIRRDAIERLPLPADAGWSDTVTATIGDITVELARMAEEELGRRSSLPDDARTWQGKWQGLGRDAAAARLALLRTNIIVFNNDLLHLVGRLRTERVDYYRLLTIAALERLRDDTMAANVEARRTLNEATWFPLRELATGARLDELQSERLSSTRQLSTDEYATAVSALELLRPGGAAGSSSSGFPDGTIGQVVNGVPFTTGFAEVDQAIGDLRGETRVAEDQELVRMARIAAALPGDPARPLECRVELLTLDSSGAAVRAGDRFPAGKLLVDGQPRGAAFTLQGQSVDLGSLDYPGPSIGFEFTRTEGLVPRPHVETVAGPWAPLAILHAFRDTARTTDGGTTWEVEMIFEDSTDPAGQLECSLWLRLRFDQPLPPLSEWPK